MDTVEAPQLEHPPATELEVIEKVILSDKTKVLSLHIQLQIPISDFESKKNVQLPTANFISQPFIY